MNTFGVLATRATNRANFVAFNMLQAKFHFNIGFFCVVQMDGNHVEQRRQWSNMLFDVFVNDWDQFWVRDVRAFVTCKDAPIGWWVESIKRTAWDAPYSGLPVRNRHRKVRTTTGTTFSFAVRVFQQ
jgi:hypothetical protein